MELSIDLPQAEILGSWRSETLEGGGGNDTIYGYGGDDRLFGYTADDFLYGATGNDFLYGGNGHDTLVGGNGNDHLIGGLGIDLLKGGAGNDVLIGGGNSDTLYGGAGADRFKIVAADVTILDDWGDWIGDFSQAEHDRIDLRGLNALGGHGGTPLVFIGTEAFSGNGGEVRYAVVGDLTVLEVDILGYSNPAYGGNGDYQVAIDGALTLTGSDLLL